MSCAFTEDDFPYFERGERPDVFFAGMMQYDGDRLIPQHFLVDPPAINRTMGEFLAANGIGQFAISETQKYGHVTYFWNGNRSGKFDEKLETYVEVSGDPQPFEQRPWMKAAEITDKTIEAIESGQYGLIRLNFPNGDMVGHTGSLQAAILSVEVVDLCVARLLRAVEKADGVALVTADHGHADEMWERNKDGSYKRDEKGRPKPKTSHSLRPVPFAIHARPEVTRRLQMASIEKPGLSHVAATTLRLLGLEPPEEYDPALVTIV
jgi:2,3-bisphosphoglycerate-independent phosphoglycerate mutase